MEYELGVRIDTLLARVERLENGVEWLVKAMDDNGVKPKEEDKHEESKSETPFEKKTPLKQKG